MPAPIGPFNESAFPITNGLLRLAQAQFAPVLLPDAVSPQTLALCVNFMGTIPLFDQQPSGATAWALYRFYAEDPQGGLVPPPSLYKASWLYAVNQNGNVVYTDPQIAIAGSNYHVAAEVPNYYQIWLAVRCELDIPDAAAVSGYTVLQSGVAYYPILVQRPLIDVFTNQPFGGALQMTVGALQPAVMPLLTAPALIPGDGLRLTQ